MKKINKTLHKLDSKGKLRVWQISVGEANGIPYYSVSHGQEGGKQQVTNVEVPEGKNIGRSNETTATEQCVAEATALWEKQKGRKGYTEEIPTEVPNLPMLAHKYKDYAHKIKWPAICSVKVDGCLSGDSMIKTKEFGIKTIKYIVENKVKCNVLSYNTKKKKNEYKEVLNYFKDRSLDEEVQWFEIETDDGKTLKLTGNHKVFLPELNCWRRVDELVGDENLMEN